MGYRLTSLNILGHYGSWLDIVQWVCIRFNLLPVIFLHYVSCIFFFVIYIPCSISNENKKNNLLIKLTRGTSRTTEIYIYLKFTRHKNKVYVYAISIEKCFSSRLGTSGPLCVLRNFVTRGEVSSLLHAFSQRNSFPTALSSTRISHFAVPDVANERWWSLNGIAFCASTLSGSLIFRPAIRLGCR